VLDEKALRKPGFTEGSRVTLGDGQEWTLPEYTYCFYPDSDEDGRIVASGRTSYGHDHDADLDVWLGSAEVEPVDRISAQMRVVSNLLLQNYNLEMADLQVLLRKNNADEASRDTWAAITRAVLGLSPKASAGGSERP
jgi:hypothetical protein